MKSLFISGFFISSLWICATAVAQDMKQVVEASHESARKMAQGLIQQDMASLLKVVTINYTELSTQYQKMSTVYGTTLDSLKSESQKLVKDPTQLATNLQALSGEIYGFQKLVRQRFNSSFTPGLFAASLKALPTNLREATTFQMSICAKGRATDSADILRRVEQPNPFFGDCNVSVGVPLVVRTKCAGPNGENNFAKLGNIEATGANVALASVPLFMGSGPGVIVPIAIYGVLALDSLRMGIVAKFITDGEIREAQNNYSNAQKYRFENTATAADVKKYYMEACQGISSQLNVLNEMLDSIESKDPKVLAEYSEKMKKEDAFLKPFVQDVKELEVAQCRVDLALNQTREGQEEWEKSAIECGLSKDHTERKDQILKDEKFVSDFKTTYAPDMKWRAARAQVFTLLTEASDSVQKNFSFAEQLKAYDRVDEHLELVNARIVRALIIAQDIAMGAIYAKELKDIQMEKSVFKTYLSLKSRIQDLTARAIHVVVMGTSKVELKKDFEKWSKDLDKFFDDNPYAALNERVYEITHAQGMFRQWVLK